MSKLSELSKEIETARKNEHLIKRSKAEKKIILDVVTGIKKLLDEELKKSK